MIVAPCGKQQDTARQTSGHVLRVLAIAAERRWLRLLIVARAVRETHP